MLSEKLPNPLKCAILFKYAHVFHVSGKFKFFVTHAK